MYSDPMKTRLAILSAILLVLLAFGASAQEIRTYPCEEDLIEIMFDIDSMVRLEGDVLVDLSGLNAIEGVDMVVAAHGGGLWSRLVDLPEPMLDDWAATASLELGEQVYNLNNIYRLRLLMPGDVRLAAMELEMLPGVHMAYPVALPPELPLAIDYQPMQNYQDPAASTPTGVDNEYAWTQAGGSGFGVTVCDLEYSWNYNHSDVSKAAGSQINAYTADPFSDNNHGTAVIGQLSADQNGWGVTGGCYSAALKTCGVYYGFPTPSWNVAGAIAVAVSQMAAGDVILLEQQWNYVGTQGYVPVEWYPQQTPASQGLTAIYAAITNAVGQGINVVEAGGNGGIDTDTMSWYGDSGAIIVGAGGAYTGGGWPNGDLQKLGFSSYGSRFDLQGWGENVMTTGYGAYYSAEGVNLYYTNAFNGTSSASPIVAAAVACMNGYYAANISTTPMTPAQVRATLVATGTAQITPPAGNIGPRPDLSAAIQSLVPVTPPKWTDVTTGPLGDTGYGRGVNWGDVDLDGDPDLYFTNIQSQNHLLRNDGPMGFKDITGVEGNFMFSGGAAWGDYDNDGDPDIYMGNYGNPNRIFRNDGPMTLVDAAFGPESDPADGAGVDWIDFDNDGLLDVYVTTINGAPNRLFQNVGGGMFIDATMPPMDDPIDALDAAWADYDNDGDMDCYLVRHGAPNDLMQNQGGGMFMPVPAPVLQDPGLGSGACWSDMDNDGDLDLYLVNQGSPNRLFRNDVFGFTDITNGPLGDAGFGMAATWGDYDNDGDLDLYLANNGSANKLMRNDGGGLFSDDTNGPLGDTAGGMGTAFADYDLDGDLDIYLANHGSSNKLFRNDVGNQLTFLDVDLVPVFTNGAAASARVRIVVGGQSQIRELGSDAGYCSQNASRLHFGLGGAMHVDSLIVQWPGGGTDVLLGHPANGVATVVETNSLADVDPAGPRAVRLHPGSPNPFNPSTTIAFDLPKSGSVDLAIYDVGGRMVKRLAGGVLDAGSHSRVWRGVDADGRPVPSGLYFARLITDGRRETQKLTLLK